MASRVRQHAVAGLFVLLGTIALLAAGCGTSSNAGNGNLAKSQVLNLAWASGGGIDIPTLDPGQASDSQSIPPVNLIFDGLVTLNRQLQVTNWGADKVTQSSDGLTYTFHLRAGQSFSDGTAVKASDYAFAINRSDSPCLQSPVNYYLWAIKDAQAFANSSCVAGTPTGSIKTLIGDSVVPDDGAGTLTITLAAPAGYFLDAMTYSTSYAIESSVVTGANLGADDKWLDSLKTGATGQGGSGMFYVSTWDHQGNLILKTNPHWWGVSQGKKPVLTEVDFKIFSSSDTLYNTYLSSSQFDFSNGVPPAQIASAKSRPDYYSSSYLEINTVALNWNIKPFDNLDARMAFCLAINRDLIANNVLHDTVAPSWHLVPKGMPGYNASGTGPDGVTATTGDIAKAQAHWSAYLKTVNNQAPTIKYSYNTSSSSATAYAQALIAGWNQVLPGANVQTDTTDWKTILKQEQQKKVQAYRSGWIADYPDPQDFLTLLYSTTSSYNNNTASVPSADQLMQQADAIADPAKQAQRMQMYNQAEQQLVNEVAVCPISQGLNFYMLRTYVKGFVESAQGLVATTDWPGVSIQTH
ncbi:MAG: ABC transporter substrate-binding protein [Ktedonobacterales bacterium]